jgi:glyoxylase-like metal-dependent hydrolase (beta-lactamase superfamily II)
MHRTTLGDFELTVVSDGTYFLDGGAFFGVVPKKLWSKKVTADEQNRVVTGLNSLLVRTGKKNILIETGIGNKLSEKMVRIYGQPAQLLNNLRAAGVAPEDIDVVINTHLHFDHCGWNTVKHGDRVVATFPNAKYYAPEGEWQYARHPSERDAISYISENYDPLVESGQMTLLRGGEEIVPGISVKTFPGHTAHMLAVIVSSPSLARPSFEGAQLQPRREPPKESGALAPEGPSQAKTACYISDLIPTSAHINVTWGMAFDLYPLDTIESRKRYYAQAIPERWLTVFTHDDQTPWGYVEEGEKGKLELARLPT